MIGLVLPNIPLANPEIQPFPRPPELHYPLWHNKLGQLIPLVQVGEPVKQGQALAQGLGIERFTISSAYSGTVTAIVDKPIIAKAQQQVPTIVIATAAKDEPAKLPEIQDQPLATILAQHGIVGLGGAAFPSQRKWQKNAGQAQACHTLIVNAVECEPYVQCDLGLLSTYREKLLHDLGWLKQQLGINRLILAAKTTQRDLLQSWEATAKAHDIDIALVEDRYPNGAERRLIEIITGKTIPLNQLPIDLGIVTQNIATVLGVVQAWRDGQPMTSRVVTFAGKGIKNPGNYSVPLGTPIEFCLQQVGHDAANTVQLSEGGHIMSVPIHDLQAPVQASTNCVLALDISEVPPPAAAEQACIRCGACAEACPEHLLPQQLHWFSKAQDFEKLAHYHLARCIECACCDAVCPSHIPLSQNFAKAKAESRHEQHTTQQALLAKERYNARANRVEQREQALKAKREAKKREVQANKAKPSADEAAKAEKKRAIAEAVLRAKAKRNPDE